MNDLRAILDTLEDSQLDYVFERMKQSSDAAAYKAANVAKSTFYGWTNRELLNDLAQQLKRRAKLRVQLVYEEEAENAARRIVELMGSENENVALKAAQDVIDRTSGKPKTAVDVTSGGEKVGVMFYLPDNGRDDGDGDSNS